MPVQNIGFAAPAASAPLAPWKYEIRDPRPNDVLIEVAYCGICHSDIHSVRDEWFPGTYPMVPGHEFTGVVSKVGDEVTKFKVGDRVGIGCLVGTCRECDDCKAGLQQYCNSGQLTYGVKLPDGEITYGGYGKYVIAPEDFVLRIPDSLPLDRAAPLLCAGITTYSPLSYCGLKKGGHKVGVVGLGGLGHMALQFAAAFGNEVTVLSRSDAKRDLAMSLGATDFVVTDEEYAGKVQTLDVVIDTVSNKKALDKYLNLLKRDGTYVVVGAPPTAEPDTLPAFPLIMKRRKIMGSCIGGIPETQEMLDFCGETLVLPVIEVIKGDYVNEAYERVIKSDVKFRFVIDVKGSHPALD